MPSTHSYRLLSSPLLSQREHNAWGIAPRVICFLGWVVLGYRFQPGVFLSSTVRIMGGDGEAAHTVHLRALLSVLNVMGMQCTLTGTSNTVALSLNDLNRAGLRQGISAMNTPTWASDWPWAAPGPYLERCGAPACHAKRWKGGSEEKYAKYQVWDPRHGDAEQRVTFSVDGREILMGNDISSLYISTDELIDIRLVTFIPLSLWNQWKYMCLNNNSENLYLSLCQIKS